MPEFKPGDPVRHLRTQEEGTVKSVHNDRIGTNVLEGVLVTVGKDDKVWLTYEVEPIDSTNRK